MTVLRCPFCSELPRYDRDVFMYVCADKSCVLGSLMMNKVTWNTRKKVKKIYTVTGAAKYLGVFHLTVRNWENKGLLKGFRTPGNHRRFRLEELDRVKYAK